jgi:hypothetical protein
LPPCSVRFDSDQLRRKEENIRDMRNC